jgi:Protein of unknown function (DUF3306)
MSEREDFLARWSRRKRQATDAIEDAPITAEPRASEQRMEGEKSRDNERPPETESREPLFDLTTLPSIESISAETDIRAFLVPGVPAELTRAALRRAWAADPTIRDFVGLADYAWDFHAPGAMAGFGPLEMTDELRREILGMLTRGQHAEEVESSASVASEKTSQSPEQLGPAAMSGENESPRETDMNKTGEPDDRHDVRAASQGNAAVQYQSTQQQPQASVQRRHGSALPRP